MHNLDGFENILKEKLEQQQYAYDPSQWNAIEKQLPPSRNFGKTPWKYIAAASAVVAGGLLIWQLSNNESPQIAESNLPNNSENTTLVNPNVDNANSTDDVLSPINDENLIVII